MLRTLAILSLAALVAPALLHAPTASAHSEVLTQAWSFSIGPYSVGVTPTPAPLYANVTSQGFQLDVYQPDTGNYVDVTATLQIAGPNGFRDIVEFERAHPRYYLGQTRLTEPGNHTARVVIDDGTEERFDNFFFQVYPDLPFRIRAVDPLSDFQPDTRSVLAYEVVDAVEFTRTDPFDDLTVRVEEWSADHARVLKADDIPMRHDGPGLWKADYVFQRGHYFLGFSSRAGGFNYQDMPLLHVEVLAQTGGPVVAEKEAPAPAALAAVAVAALVALAWRPRR